MMLPIVTPAQTFELKIHHPLPVSSTVHQKVLLPWCEALQLQSNGRLQCRLFPSMQLGGTVPQLIDQVGDGVVDIIWTLPGFSPGRFPMTEVFELPFMIRDAEAASRALWDYVHQHDMKEFAGMRPLALHVHGGGVFHTIDRPIRRRGDLRGMKIRAPTRQTTRFMAILGATPVGMPVPQVPEALAKGVIDGTLLPYEVMPTLKVDELTRYHSEPGSDQPKIYTSVFVLGMNKARYDSLPTDLKKIIDANSGIELSARIGSIFGQAEVINRQPLPPASINVISDQEIASWKKFGQPIIDGWVRDVTKSGADGKMLLDAARKLIADYEAKSAGEKR
ncbi:MAG: TRAP transporter substrate-binding protein [Betaproteobacteria bacterium]|nr:MAG: TRAP transporter substrate-binding protein [Betaproteobacteria bacterium]